LYAQLYNPKTIEKKYSKISITTKQRKVANEWIKKLKNKELEKEKKNYFVFRDVVLRDLLGYPEEKILYEEKNVEFSIQDEHGDTGVCFEAKGTKTKDLFARQGYEKKEQENPVVQTLSDMKRFPASYGVCTNYRNFVLLDIKKRLSKCHRFDFLSIENSDKKLKEFLGIFSYKNLVIEKTLDDLYNSSVSEEREFTNEFYKLFHETRLMLIKAFQEKEKVTMNEAIHYAQLYLNRLIFIFFAEDKGDIEDRLFSKRVLKILEDGQGTESTRLVSDDILKLFKYLDKGSDVQGIFGFNGGLFKEKIPPKIYFFDLKNPEFFAEVKQHSKLSKKIVLDELSSKIVKKYKNKLNPIISNLLIMDSFDFNTEVNVNILGHIFEQSISDLEDLRKEGTTRRRKEGVFYTPEYITEYICTKTIIPYLSKNNAATVTELIGEYLENPEELESRIRKIKILDLACGSGAFLIKAVEILLEIDKEIQSIKPQIGGQSHLEDWSNEKEITKIIEKNVFGVDINEESVEITKLSLLLKMATPNKKLSNLSDNIKVGNSVVDDKKLDEKAFCWEKEFSDIFKEGGFDIVIGNPPYVRNTILPQKLKKHFTKFESAEKQYDLYVLFLEQGLLKLVKNGRLGFIVPNKLLSADYSTKLREFLLRECTISKIVDISNLPVFKDAATYPIIPIFSKNLDNEFNQIDIIFCDDENNLYKEPDYFILQSDFSKNEDSEFLIHADTEMDKILEKIEDQSDQLVEFYKARKGIETGKDKERTYISDTKPKEKNHKPVLGANVIGRYSLNWNNRYIIYDPKILNGARKPEYFEREKIVTGRTVKRLSFYLDTENFYTLDTTQILYPVKNVNQLNILGLINSKLINFYYSIRFKDSHMRGGYVRCYTNFLEKIPIHKKIHEIDKNFPKKVQTLLNLNSEFIEEKKKFWNRIVTNFQPSKSTKKLDNFFLLQFTEFLKEIQKISDTKLTLQEQDEWEDYFESHKKQFLELKTKSEKIDEEINQIIYQFYGLTSQEISVVEDNYPKIG